MLTLVGELHSRRISMVLGKEGKRQGKPLLVMLESSPEHIKEGIKTVAKLHRRFARGDYRHNPRDVGQLETLCNYLIEVHQTAAGHPVRPVHFTVESMQAKMPCTPGTYDRTIVAVREQIG
jgi:hypothetical protein